VLSHRFAHACGSAGRAEGRGRDTALRRRQPALGRPLSPCAPRGSGGCALAGQRHVGPTVRRRRSVSASPPAPGPVQGVEAVGRPRFSDR